MQAGYTFLNLTLLWVNTWATFKTLNRRWAAKQSTRSSRFQQKTRRDMKTCLSVWVVWVSWKLLERVIDATVGMVIPFLHEMKCLFILLLIITRPWGTEPLVMNVLRPTIRPYTGIIDASLYWLELGGDFMFLVLCLPYQMFISWWNSSPEDSKPILDLQDSSNSSTATHSPAVVEPPPFAALIQKPVTIQDTSSATQAAIEAHRKEQEQQAQDEVRMKEIQERSARDRLAHLRLVTKPPLPLPPKNPGVSRTLNAAMQSVSSSSSDLPASAINLPINRKVSRDALRSNAPMPMPVPTVISSQRGHVPTAEEERPSIYPIAALAMPMPIRAQPKQTRPAIHTNVTANISRPANPAPQVPSVIPLTTQTLPRFPRVRPERSSPPPGLGSRTVGARSTDTLLASGSSSSTLPLSEFGVGGHRRGSADDETVSGESQTQRSQGSGSVATTNGTGGGAQTWEDFMASLERQNQAAIHHPRGTSGLHEQINGSTPNNNLGGMTGVLATRENREIMKRIAGMKKEVDEKMQRINERAGKTVISTGTATMTTSKPAAVGQKKGPGRVTASATTGIVGNRTKAFEKMQVEEPHHAGQKRPRRALGHLAAKAPLDGSSSSGEGGDDKPSPKRKKKELVDTDGDMDMDDATLASSSVKGVKSTARSTRVASTKVKDKVIVPVAPSRASTVRSTRSTTLRSADVAVIPGVAMRTRGRGGGG